jgi:uncharacterized lipoprotein YehR (DUF1307 family)
LHTGKLPSVAMTGDIMKKTLFFICMVLTLSLTACGKDENHSSALGEKLGESIEKILGVK